MTPSNPSGVTSSDAARRFPGRSFSIVKKFSGTLVDGTPVYFRQGTPTSRGWQITIRVREPIGQHMIEGRGFLCINSSSCWLIPFSVLRDWLGDRLQNQTVDVFFRPSQETLITSDRPPIAVGEFRAP